MVVDSLLSSLINGGAVTTGTFIGYLIYQSSLDRNEKKEERALRISEKNQFIKILGDIKEELIHLKILHNNKK